MTDLTPLIPRGAALLTRLRAAGWTLATAESCTGGLIIGLLTEIAGSSDVVDRGFVTYSNQAKTDLLGVDAGLIGSIGAVSEGVALAMAEGALERAGVTLAVAVTGIAGPGGGSLEKPVGLVHFALAVKNAPTVHAVRQFGEFGRSEVRLATVETALTLIETALAERGL